MDKKWQEFRDKNKLLGYNPSFYEIFDEAKALRDAELRELLWLSRHKECWSDMGKKIKEMLGEKNGNSS